MHHPQEVEPRAHLALPLVVGYSREDKQIRQVEEEVQTEHLTRKLLPLGLQQLSQQVRLEHCMAVLTGDRSPSVGLVGISIRAGRGGGVYWC